MGYVIDFAPEALDDLKGIVREIAKDNPERKEEITEMIADPDVVPWGQVKEE